MPKVYRRFRLSFWTLRRTVRKALAGIIRGNDFDESDVFALSRTTLGWLAEFAERWSQGMYSDRELDELMRKLERRA